MNKPLRIALLAFSVAGAMAALPQTAHAYFKHHHKVVHHVSHKKHHAQINEMVRDAQTSLINLGYLNGKADGILGPKTTKAIKGFQKDNHLHVDGRLTQQVYNAIVRADRSRAMSSLPMPMGGPTSSPVLPPVHDTLLAQPGLVGPTSQDYADPLLGGVTVAGGGVGAPQSVRTQTLSSRYAKLDINENTNGPLRRYNLTLNGTSLLQVDNQPSVIGISETYSLPNEDVLVVTTYRDGDTLCPYKHYILALAQNKNELYPIGNCTHGYQARKVEDSVFVTFPETDDQRMAPATWRYEGGDLERL